MVATDEAKYDAPCILLKEADSDAEWEEVLLPGSTVSELWPEQGRCCSHCGDRRDRPKAFCRYFKWPQTGICGPETEAQFRCVDAARDAFEARWKKRVESASRPQPADDRGRVCKWCNEPIAQEQTSVLCDVCDDGPYHIVHERAHKRAAHTGHIDDYKQSQASSSQALVAVASCLPICHGES